MTSRTILNDLLTEIEAVHEPFTEPEESLRPTDTVAGEAGVDIKRVFTLQRRYAKKAYAQQLILIAGVEDRNDLLMMRETEAKTQILTALLWHLIALQFPTDKQKSHGIRAGWKLVVPAITPDTHLTDLQDESKIEVVN